jgi:hypothetical protein
LIQIFAFVHNCQEASDSLANVLTWSAHNFPRTCKLCHSLLVYYQLWIQPEGKELRDAFSKLKKLCIHGIYVDFDLFWIINLLEASGGAARCLCCQATTQKIDVQ